MCLRLDYGKPNYFLPRDCEFSYGDRKCDCDVDQSNACYTFNCNGVVPEALQGVIVAEKCKEVNLVTGGDVHMFLPALTDLPGEKVSNQDEQTGLTPIEEGFLAQAAANEAAQESTNNQDTPDTSTSSGFRPSRVIMGSAGIFILGLIR